MCQKAEGDQHRGCSDRDGDQVQDAEVVDGEGQAGDDHEAAEDDHQPRSDLIASTEPRPHHDTTPITRSRES